jgi:hypothetical protein
MHLPANVSVPFDDKSYGAARRDVQAIDHSFRSRFAVQSANLERGEAKRAGQLLMRDFHCDSN